MKDKLCSLFCISLVLFFIIISLCFNLIICTGKSVIDFSNGFFDEDGSGIDTIKKIVPYVIVSIFILFVVDVFAFFNSYEVESEDNQAIGLLGTFGDFFGGTVNPILTFLTFVGLLTTIALQRKELRLTRDELATTAAAMQIQTFETTFFNMLNLLDNMVAELKISGNPLGVFFEIKMFNFKNALKDVFLKEEDQNLLVDFEKNFYNQLHFKKRNFEASGKDTFKEVINSILEFLKVMRYTFDRITDVYGGKDFYNENFSFFINAQFKMDASAAYAYSIINKDSNELLGSYFRVIYQILKLVDQSSLIADADRTKYSGLLRAKLSQIELALLFLNCQEGVCDDGKFKNLLCKYKIFEHLQMEGWTDGSYKLANLFFVKESEVDWYRTYVDIPVTNKENKNGAYGNNLYLR